MTFPIPMFVCRDPAVAGHGFIGGEAPYSSDPEAPDGRSRILNEPARVRVLVISRLSLRAIDSVLSNPDGTWRVENLNPNMDFIVLGLDGLATVNAAVQDWVRPHVPEP